MLLPNRPSPTPLHVFGSNIRPIRAVLRQRHGCNKKGVRAFFPYVPWERARRVVADEDSNDSRALQMRSSGHLRVDGGLEQILNFPPLLLAFDDFCVKALCIEVRQTRFHVSPPPTVYDSGTIVVPPSNRAEAPTNFKPPPFLSSHVLFYLRMYICQRYI